MEQNKKREVPSLLKTVLSVDAYITESFVKSVERLMPIKQLKIHYRALEISCHAIPWLASLLAFIWILNNKNLYQMQVNLLLGMLVDIVIVALLKATTRRRRPAVNDDPFAMGPDKFSFPSGHATRSTFIYYFFTYLWPVSTFYTPPLFAWLVAVCTSRLLMRRHYLLDVCAGILIGLLEGLFIGYIYLEHQTCVNLISWITDEKIDGAEYDI